MVRLPAVLSRYRHGYLLVALLAFAFVKPFVDHDEAIGDLDVLDVMFGVVMLAAVYSTSKRRADFVVFIVLAAISMAVRIAWSLSAEPEKALTVAYSLTAAAAWGYATLVVLRTVFGTSDRVTADTIYAAVSGYLLVGMLWTLLYVALHQVQGGAAFELGVREIGDGQALEETLLGFSFTTLTTLGYGNIVPKTPQADALATLEAIFGQMYVAILVARLVGVQVAQSTARQVLSDEGD